jgi:hypothetical protein
MNSFVVIHAQVPELMPRLPHDTLSYEVHCNKFFCLGFHCPLHLQVNNLLHGQAFAFGPASAQRWETFLLLELKLQAGLSCLSTGGNG